MHTAPPFPLFIHCAQLSLHPPEEAPPQFRVMGAASAHVPLAGLPNCWTTGAGPGSVEELEEDERLVNPPPVAAHVAIIVLGLGVSEEAGSVKMVASAEPT